MAQPLFKELAYAERLRRGGFSDAQAVAAAEALSSALAESVATRSDLDALEGRLSTEIKELRAELTADIQKLRTEFTADNQKLRMELTADNQKQRTEFSLSIRDNTLAIKDTAIALQASMTRMGYALGGFLLAVVGLAFAGIKYLH